MTEFSPIKIQDFMILYNWKGVVKAIGHHNYQERPALKVCWADMPYECWENTGQSHYRTYRFRRDALQVRYGASYQWKSIRLCGIQIYTTHVKIQ